jgi:teichuronic acid biosynthesis glycosyltransferase TuaG
MISNINIDIIIPNYNKSQYLEECINSVVSQTFKNWKLYIVDDFSTDNSLQVIEKYNTLNNINIIKLKKNKGPAFCRNLGVRISSSPYISFLDSDDLWVKNKLEKQIIFMIKNKFSFTFSDYYWFKNINSKDYKSTQISNSLSFREFLNNSSINSSTMILKRDIIKNTRFKNVNHEDYLFKCDILRSGVVAYKINDKLAYYRIIKTSRSSNKFVNLFYLWKINSKYNKLNFFKNLISVISISINSLKKYGFK